MIDALVILVNWKRAEDTCLCIDSLLKSNLNNIRISIGICENGSEDDSKNIIFEYLEDHFKVTTDGGKIPLLIHRFELNKLLYQDISKSYRSAFLAISSRNLGFAGGNNLAFREISKLFEYDYVWFLNNDTEIESNTLAEMVSRMQSDEKIGICGSTLVYAHDRKTVQALGGAVYKTWTGGVHEIGNGLTWPCTVDQAEVEARMSYVSGASMLVSAAFLEKVGLMSEDYFLYYEEIDWATRARRAGFKLGYASASVVYHKEGAALGSGKSQQRSALAEYYGVRNRIVFIRKFFPWALPSAYLFSWMQVGKRLLQGHGKRARMMAAVLLGLRRTPPVGR